MLEILIFIGLSAYILSSTEDKNKSSPKDTNTYNNEKIHNLKLKIENMTTYELNRWLRENNWDYEYKEYSREYKVNKIVELMQNKL